MIVIYVTKYMVGVIAKERQAYASLEEVWGNREIFL